MKIVDVPTAVKAKQKAFSQATMKLEVVEEEVKFSKYLEFILDGHEAFCKTPKMARKYGKLMDKIEKMDGAATIIFEDDDYDIMKAAAETAKWPTPSINRSYLPYYDAIANAQECDEDGNRKEKKDFPKPMPKPKLLENSTTDAEKKEG